MRSLSCLSQFSVEHFNFTGLVLMFFGFYFLMIIIFSFLFWIVGQVDNHSFNGSDGPDNSFWYICCACLHRRPPCREFHHS